MAADAAPNISSVIQRGLCHLCGTCYAVCPRDNIERGRTAGRGFRFRVLDPAQCQGCGLCAQACPGAAIDLRALNEAAFGQVPEDPMVGVVRGLYLTRAADDHVRQCGASGGTASALQRYVLDQGIVDGVRTTRLGTDDDPLAPHPFVARSAGDLAGTAGSIYQLTPANAALHDQLRGDVRLACVGLGCHTRGLRKAAQVAKPFREKVALLVGIFCGHNATPAGQDHLLRRLGVDPAEVTRIRYRAGPHPGSLRVETRGGGVHQMSFRAYTYFLTAFENPRCALCTDPLNALADLAIGDAWLPHLREKGGWNLTIVRSARGEAIFRQAVDDGALVARPAEPDVIQRTQALVLYRRNRAGEARARILRLLGRSLPHEPGMVREKPRRRDYVHALQLLALQWLFGGPLRRRLVEPILPLLLAADRRTMRRKDKAAGRSADWIQQFEESEGEGEGRGPA
ncbi:MAG: Coenzyme F420 hydrogenase/dehydrogenase, beta subunit C-terminal domain [Candidatus Brocadiia bacterium]